MDLTFRPEVERFIDDQVKKGRFASPEALIEAALSEFQPEAAELDDSTVSAINEGLQQSDRGEGVELDQFRTRFFERHS